KTVKCKIHALAFPVKHVHALMERHQVVTHLVGDTHHLHTVGVDQYPDLRLPLQSALHGAVEHRALATLKYRIERQYRHAGQQQDPEQHQQLAPECPEPPGHVCSRRQRSTATGNCSPGTAMATS